MVHRSFVSPGVGFNKQEETMSATPIKKCGGFCADLFHFNNVIIENLL